MMLQINYMDGVKQAATLVFLLVYFFKYEMGYDNEEETKFLKWRSNMVFSMTSILQHTVEN